MYLKYWTRNGSLRLKSSRSWATTAGRERAVPGQGADGVAGQGVDHREDQERRSEQYGDREQEAARYVAAHVSPSVVVRDSLGDRDETIVPVMGPACLLWARAPSGATVLVRTAPPAGRAVLLSTGSADDGDLS